MGFEVVAEGPVAQHLEERVVVGVQAHVVEVVVLAARADALLRVRRARRQVGGLLGAEEVGYELVHTRVGEEQVGRGRQQAGARHDAVLLLAEKIEERLADLGGSHGELSNKTGGCGWQCRNGPPERKFTGQVRSGASGQVCAGSCRGGRWSLPPINPFANGYWQAAGAVPARSPASSSASTARASSSSGSAPCNNRAGW